MAQESEEHQQFRSSLRAFFEARSPEAEVRRVMDEPRGYDPALWKEMAQQLGLQGLTVDEAHGGSGFGWPELGIVMEEMGRALVCAPYLSTVGLAVPALRAIDDHDAVAHLLSSIASGDLVCALAVAEEVGDWSQSEIKTRAQARDGDYQLTGCKNAVIDGADADVLLVAARTEDGVALFEVNGDAPGLARTPLTGLDQTRRLARVDLQEVPARLLGSPETGWAAVESSLDHGVLALAAESVGGMQRCLEESATYARIRYQFGRPIGSFQAVKHLCADMVLRTESARSIVHYGIDCAERDSEELGVVASAAAAYVQDAYFRVTRDTIQVHGGVAYTWEHPAHLYHRRAKASQVLLGDGVRHRDRVASAIGMDT